MLRPSFCGLMPRSEARMAFSMGLSVEESQGWMSRLRGSGVEMVAICWMGVGVP